MTNQARGERQRQRILEYLDEVGNSGATFSEIRDGTGMRRGSLSYRLAELRKSGDVTWNQTRETWPGMDGRCYVRARVDYDATMPPLLLHHFDLQAICGSGRPNPSSTCAREG